MNLTLYLCNAVSVGVCSTEYAHICKINNVVVSMHDYDAIIFNFRSFGWDAPFHTFFEAEVADLTGVTPQESSTARS